MKKQTTNPHRWLPEMDKTVLEVVPLFEASDEKAYWLARTPQERLQHVEVLRHINYGHHATARLQRVLDVIECPWR